MATRILLIEDEPLLSSLYSLVLSKSGYQVETALDAETGEEKLVLTRPHVVLLDLLIPKRPQTDTHGEDFHEPSGFDILRLVKGTPSLQEIRVIVLSNLDSDEHVRTARSLGADEYLIKSNLDPHQLQAEVERILHGPASRPAKGESKVSSKPKDAK